MIETTRFKWIVPMMTMILIVTSAFAGCLWGSDDDDDEDEERLVIKGSTTVLPVAQALADEFMKTNNVDIALSGGGSSVGVTSAADGTAHIGMASRDLKASEKSDHPDLQEHVIAADGIAVIVHTSNPVNSLSEAKVKDIYTGVITNWQDVGGPDMVIVVMIRDSASGTGEFFSEHVMKKEEVVAGALEKNSNGAMHSSIMTTQGGIGYVGLGFLDADVKPLKIEVEGGRSTTLVEPSVENVKSGAYPIARNLNFITKGNPTGMAKTFLDFTWSQQGQSIVEDTDFVPVRETGREKGTLTIKGSTTVVPVAQAAAEAYMALHSGVDIAVSGGGSSVGVTAAADGTADIGMASRDLKTSEKTDHPDLQQHVIAMDGLAVIVHKDNPVGALTLDQIKDIYTGSITNWKDVGGEDRSIVVMVRDSASGTGEFFWEFVLKKEEVVAGALEKNSNGAMHSSISTTQGGIGYVGLGFLDEDVKALPIHTDEYGNIEPSVRNVLLAKYPIARNLNFITKGDPTGLQKNFIDFVLSEAGQAIVEGLDFVPLKEIDITGTIIIKGSTTVLPVTQALAEVYMGLNPSIDMVVSGGGSSVGVTSAVDGTAHIGMASRDLKDSEKTNNPDLQQHVIAKDGIAVIVHQDNPVGLLSMEQIKAIFTGSITNWKDVGGEDRDIVVMIRDSASGTGEFFWEFALQKEEYASGALEKNSNGAVHSSVMNTPGGIGYVGLGFVDDDIKPLRILNNGMKILPTIENVKRGTYPIARNLNYITKGNPNDLAQDFMDFVMGMDGQAIVEQQSFVSLIDTHTPGTLSIKGSTTVLPIAQAVADAYMAYYDDVDIAVSGGGSSVGVTAAADGTADIGMASRDLKDSEKTNYPDLQEHVIARDGIALIVHKDNPVTNLTRDQIKAIYNGSITNWKDVGGNDQAIVVMIRDAASGTGEFFWEFVLNKEEYADGALEKNSNGAMHDSVMNTEAAIGYVGLGFLSDDIKPLLVNEDENLVTPTVANVLNGEYPIARSLHFLTMGDPTGLVKEFIDFILSGEGQKIVEDQGFVPLI